MVEVILHVKIGFPEDKRVTVGNITAAIKDLEHFQDKNTWALKSRIDQTVAELKKIVRYCSEKNYESSKFQKSLKRFIIKNSKRLSENLFEKRII